MPHLRYDNGPLFHTAPRHRPGPSGVPGVRFDASGAPQVDPEWVKAESARLIAEARAKLARGGASPSRSDAARHAVTPSRVSQGHQERNDAPDPVEAARRKMIVDSRNAWRTSRPAVVAKGHRRDADEETVETAAPAESETDADEAALWSQASGAVDRWREAAGKLRAPVETADSDAEDEPSHLARANPDDEMHGDGRSAEDAMRKMHEDTRNAWKRGAQ